MFVMHGRIAATVRRRLCDVPNDNPGKRQEELAAHACIGGLPRVNLIYFYVCLRILIR